MLILKDQEWDAKVGEHDWWDPDGVRPKHESTGVCYETHYEACGVVGADMADDLLEKFVNFRIESGCLRVIWTYVDGVAQIKVFLELLGAKIDAEGVPPIAVYIAKSDHLLLAALAWCIACGWQFVFFAEDVKFAVQGCNDEWLKVGWHREAQVQPQVPELLAGHDFGDVRLPQDGQAGKAREYRK